jgi:hypothetical protein
MPEGLRQSLPSLQVCQDHDTQELEDIEKEENVQEGLDGRITGSWAARYGWA